MMPRTGVMNARQTNILERVRKSREVMSEFIRIGLSDLYDWHVTRRALPHKELVHNLGHAKWIVMGAFLAAAAEKVL